MLQTDAKVSLASPLIIRKDPHILTSAWVPKGLYLNVNECLLSQNLHCFLQPLYLDLDSISLSELLSPRFSLFLRSSNSVVESLCSLTLCLLKIMMPFKAWLLVSI